MQNFCRRNIAEICTSCKKEKKKPLGSAILHDGQWIGLDLNFVAVYNSSNPRKPNLASSGENKTFGDSTYPR